MECFEHQVVIDWFGEPEYQYTAIALEDDCPAPAGCKWIPIRSLFAKQNSKNEAITKAARAHSILKWRKKYRYCPHCGTQMQDDKFETARTCPDCQTHIYPTVTPAMIVLVEKDGEILLARHKHRNNDVYTCLAGFIEAGESAEEAAAKRSGMSHKEFLAEYKEGTDAYRTSVVPELKSIISEVINKDCKNTINKLL